MALRSVLGAASALGRRPAVLASRAAALPVLAKRTAARAVSTIDFGGVKERVYERADYPKAAVQAAFKADTLAMLGWVRETRCSFQARPHDRCPRPLARAGTALRAAGKR